MTLFFLDFLISGLGNNRRQLAWPYGKQDSSLARSNREKQVPLQMDSIFPRMVSSYIHQLVCTMYMNPHSCQETWIQHRKAQEIGEHDLSGFTAWISKKLISNHESSHMLLLLLVPIPKEHGIKKRTRSIRKHCLTEQWGMGGRHSSYVPSTPQPAIIIYYIIY
jgi:hypothetical protein